jgi:hypothetical protein
LKYIERRAGDFTGYAPKEAAIAKKGVVALRDCYVALLICEDPEGAKSDFLKCFGGDLPKLPAGAADGAYDAKAILAAWEGGDAEALSENNRKILDACAEAIESAIADGMDDYEKELAMHDWIVEWANYDEGALDNGPLADPDPDNDNPYGLLLHKKAICAGYSSTFQLFMDLLGIECITVNGYSGDLQSEEHAWNMVKIDGEWYCVDVTWDDPLGIEQAASETHKYFNVPSSFMRETGHHWDDTAAPKATAGKLWRSENDLNKLEGAKYAKIS